MKNKVSIERQGKINNLDDLLNQFSISLRCHSHRVAVCSAIIAENANAFKNFFDIPAGMSLPVVAHLGGTCHDIGKLMLPALEARGDEYMKHPAMGADLLKKHKGVLFSNKPFAHMVIDIVRYHHEKADGTGFPEGLRSGDIPLIAGICSVANKLDHHMYSRHKHSGDAAKILKILEAQVDKQFIECIWVCVERAWSRLAERYAVWNHLTYNHNRNES